MELSRFLQEDVYIDFSSPVISRRACELFRGVSCATDKAERAFLFVRDEISHSFDCGARTVTAKASEVLRCQTGICHAKANLLAALLRHEGIPAGLRFQHITLAEDDSLGYCVHCFNAVYLDGRWIELDARGNTNGINAKFSMDKPRLAFENRAQYDEYTWPGIYAAPHPETMKLLEDASSTQDVFKHMPDEVHTPPDIMDK